MDGDRIDDGMVVWEEDGDIDELTLALREIQAEEMRDNLGNSEEGAPDFETM